MSIQPIQRNISIKIAFFLTTCIFATVWVFYAQVDILSARLKLYRQTSDRQFSEIQSRYVEVSEDVSQIAIEGERLDAEIVNLDYLLDVVKTMTTANDSETTKIITNLNSVVVKQGEFKDVVYALNELLGKGRLFNIYDNHPSISTIEPTVPLRIPKYLYQIYNGGTKRKTLRGRPIALQEEIDYLFANKLLLSPKEIKKLRVEMTQTI